MKGIFMANNSETYLETISIMQKRIKVLEKQLEHKVLQGKEEIMEAYKWTDYQYKKLVKLGLPILIVDRTHYAHKDNIDDFFKAATRRSYKDAPDNLLDD